MGASGLLERFFDLLEASGPLRINIEDYLGIFEDVPGLRIPQRYFGHTCGFCQHAKERGFRDCFSNKRAVNRVLQSRKAPFTGRCHLGLTDLVHPVLVDGVAVAGLYYGSVLVAGTEADARRRIRAYCRRRRRSPAPYLARLATAPTVSASELEPFRFRLALAADLFARLIRDSGIPLSRYHQQADAQSARARAGLPTPLQAALRHLARAYPQPLTRESVARQVRCHPNYLSGLFTRHLGLGFRQYLRDLRIERARQLLRNTDHAISEIAFAVGFEEPSYFNRCFRKATGTTPTDWRKQGNRADEGMP